MYKYGAAWNAVVLFLTMVMGKIGIASRPFWLKTRTRISKDPPDTTLNGREAAASRRAVQRKGPGSVPCVDNVGRTGRC